MRRTSYIEPRKSRVIGTRDLADFQNSIQRYMWGTTNPSVMDLTSPKTLKSMMNTLNPMVLRNNSHSGVTLVLEVRTEAERRMIDNLMGQYGQVANQSSSYIYQHATMESSAVKVTKTTSTPSEVQQNLLDALTRDGEVSKEYVDTVSVMRNMLDGASADGAADKDAPASDDDVKHTLYLKLYPQACNIDYPRERISVKQLSQSRLLPLSTGRTNPKVNLKNIIAFNTYDTQWVDVYSSFFDLWFKHFSNRSIDVIIGDYILRKMMLTTSPVIPNGYKNLEFFDVSLVSEYTELEDFVR